MRLQKLQKQFANASNTFNWISIISKGITLWLSYNNTTYDVLSKCTVTDGLLFPEWSLV